MNLTDITTHPAGTLLIIRDGNTHSLATLTRPIGPGDRTVPVNYTHILNPVTEPAPWNHRHPRRSLLGVPGAGWAVTPDEVTAAGDDAVHQFTQAWQERRRNYLTTQARLNAKRAKAHVLANA